MLNLDSDDLFEVTLIYERILKFNPRVDEEQKLIVRALLLTQSLDKTMFITELEKEEILKAYSMLKNALSNLENVNEESISNSVFPEKKRREQINRKEAIEYIISMLSRNNPGLSIKSRSYNTITASINNRNINIKIKLSNNFEDTYHRSWHKEALSDTSQYDYHIYLVENKKSPTDRYRALLFTTEEIQGVIAKKQVSKNNTLHYYFDWGTKGKVVDDRENMPIDVTFADADTRKAWKLN
jgi:hypothetical protein